MNVILLILRRLFLLVFVLLAVSILIFLIVNVLPGDIADLMLGEHATPEQVAVLRERLGLNEPVLSRYFIWLGNALSGDLGVSMQHNQPIAPLLAARLYNSAILGGIGLILSVPIAIGLGLIAAVNRETWIDRTISSFVVFNFALPEYVLGLMLILCFSIWWNILPGVSLIAAGSNPLDKPLALVLPVFVVTMGLITYVSQITRATMIEVLDSAYIRTARLKGMSRATVLLRHALPNVMLPVIAEVGMHLGYVIGGIVIIETMFSYAGVGQMLITSVNHRDVPTIQATVLVVACAYGIGNLLADVFSVLVNPKLRTA
jgi:peptide/nickel transport system permease protein